MHLVDFQTVFGVNQFQHAHPDDFGNILHAQHAEARPIHFEQHAFV
jgi:hypothetical protein